MELPKGKGRKFYLSSQIVEVLVYPRYADFLWPHWDDPTTTGKLHLVHSGSAQCLIIGGEMGQRASCWRCTTGKKLCSAFFLEN